MKKIATNKDNVERTEAPRTVAESTPLIKVPVRVLPESEGIVASEVVSKDGAVILPAGINLSLFSSSMEKIVKRIEAQGIEWVYLHAPQQLSEEDIDIIIDKVYSQGDNAPISKEKAKNVIKEVDTLFHTIRDDELSPEIVSSLSNMGVDLAEDLVRNPSVAFSLGKVHEADEYTFVHSFNVAVLTGYLANRMHPGDRTFINKMVLGALLHDTGKAKIPTDILNKPGPLTQEEFQIMKGHPKLGIDLAREVGVSDPDILAVIGGHHEKWSGKGYPDGTSGTQIPEAARISAVADVFDALTAKRVYKSSMSSRNAITIILKDAGVHFDVKIARELLTSIGLYPPGSIVALSDGRVGVVVSGGGRDLVRPLILLKSSMRKDGEPIFIDLKTAKDLCIARYLGHGDKRDMEY